MSKRRAPLDELRDEWGKRARTEADSYETWLLRVMRDMGPTIGRDILAQVSTRDLWSIKRTEAWYSTLEGVSFLNSVWRLKAALTFRSPLQPVPDDPREIERTAYRCFRNLRAVYMANPRDDYWENAFAILSAYVAVIMYLNGATSVWLERLPAADPQVRRDPAHPVLLYAFPPPSPLALHPMLISTLQVDGSHAELLRVFDEGRSRLGGVDIGPLNHRVGRVRTSHFLVTSRFALPSTERYPPSIEWFHSNSYEVTRPILFLVLQPMLISTTRISPQSTKAISRPCAPRSPTSRSGTPRRMVRGSLSTTVANTLWKGYVDTEKSTFARYPVDRSSSKRPASSALAARPWTLRSPMGGMGDASSDAWTWMPRPWGGWTSPALASPYGYWPPRPDSMT